MIAIIDYGVGNLFSLQSSLKFIGADAEVTNDIAKIKAADRIILPGVGAFADAIRKLRESGMEQVVLEEAAESHCLAFAWVCRCFWKKATNMASMQA